MCDKWTCVAHPELDKQFELEVDASGYTVGAILLQRKADSIGDTS